ncbi:hypothetical protein BKA04_000103 [Cryobacterium mesophilum]|uniref:PH domain-containing protein n=1 Tax=Terrimesophilobacter mesophilus TaxID=433647 RepID=A0A4R8V9Q4_9MICO|nr:hypothetical protein [Terrimesophilobacter mesophilus]MBB5631880.1 hypothetical protein [Terrimesophilobacter mesophilus]TFB78790.1 hypothetical protein E3N84_01075 [Terrimesophilobacter mesophilus]
MDRLIPTVIIVAVLVLAILAMYLGWRARKKRQGDFEPPASVPDDPGRTRAKATGQYVATTIAHEPLERVAVHGLGFGSRADLTVTEFGLIFAITGRAPVFIAREDISRVDRATWTIDRAVETGGLVLVGWHLGEHDVESWFRIDGDEGAFLDAVSGLIGEEG